MTGSFYRLATRPDGPYDCKVGGYTYFGGECMYEAPKLEKFGTFRELTLAGGSTNAADATNPYHRYGSLPA